MSGICAVWRSRNPEQVAETAGRIATGLSLARTESIAVESGDGAAVAVSARFDTQQIYRNERMLVACDAELLNESELRDLVSLPAIGAGLPAAGAARMLAALYDRFGVDFVGRLRGGFALMLWDRCKRELLAAIDGFGIKRLAYHQDATGLMVASRVDALARSGEIDTAINPRAIASVLNFSASLGPETIFAHVVRLAPGTMLLASHGSVRLRKYWDLDYWSGHGDTNVERLSRELDSVVESSVAAHCGSEPFGEQGAFLSGGTDSSTVVGMMSRLGRGKAKAFSIGFQEQPFNELGYAEIAAKRFGAGHYTYLVGPDACFEALPDMIRYFDEPYGNSSAIPTYFCARLAAQNGVNTLLAGDGGDELFGGNERYATDKIFETYQHVPAALRAHLIEPLVAGFPGEPTLIRKARGYIRRARMSGVERMLSFQFLATHPIEEVFERDFAQVLGNWSIVDVPARHYSNAAARDHLDRLLYVDMKITLADNDLPKVTCMAELAGIRVRFPFLDREVAEFSGRVPARLKVKGFDKRYLFKRAFRNLLPAEIIRKKKHGFGIPVAVWMKTDRRLRELTHDTLLSARALERGYFRRPFVEDLMHRHETEESTYYGDTLWTFLSLELWHRQLVDLALGIAV